MRAAALPKTTIAARISERTLAALDQYVAEHGHRFPRSRAIETLIVRGFDSTRADLESGETGAFARPDGLVEVRVCLPATAVASFDKLIAGFMREHAKESLKVIK